MAMSDLATLLERLRTLGDARSRQHVETSGLRYLGRTSRRLGSALARAIVTLLVTIGALVVLSVALDALR
jgi:hypothetical protein